jgi:hypothetical protein
MDAHLYCYIPLCTPGVLMYIFCATVLQEKLNSKDLSFVGYTYKNFDAVKGLKHAGLCPVII